MFKNLLRYSWLWYILRWLCDGVRRHTISKLIIRYVLWSCYNVVRLNLRSYHIARPSYDIRTTSYMSHDHCTTPIYKAMLPSHHAIIVMPYVIVRLSFDYCSTGVRCRTIYLWFSFPPSNHSQVRMSSYDYHSTVLWCHTISQTLPMRRKLIVSNDHKTTIVIS